MSVRWIGCASNNYAPGRPAGESPTAIVIHIIVGSLSSAGYTFLDPMIQPRRSAHYGVGRDGVVHQFVRETDSAFHSGVVDRPTAPLVLARPGVNPNGYTIGIEHEGYPDVDWPAVQVATSAALIGEVARRWAIPLDAEHVILHHEIRFSKSCPGPRVDRARLLRLAEASASPGSPSGLPVGPGFPRPIVIAKRANLRGSPSLLAPVIEVLPSRTALVALASVTGDPAGRGNALWYRTVRPVAYVWSGAVES